MIENRKTKEIEEDLKEDDAQWHFVGVGKTTV